MEVDESLINKDINMQLAELNEGREHLLGLNEFSLVRGYKAIDWGKRKVSKFKAWFQENFD